MKRSTDLIDQMQTILDRMHELLPAEDEKQARLLEEETNAALVACMTALRNNDAIVRVNARKFASDVLKKRLARVA